MKNLLIVQTFHSLAENINFIFLSLFLWKSASLQTLILFRFQELLIIPLAAIIATFLMDRTSPKWTFLLGLGIFFGEMLSIVFLKSNITHRILPHALTSGAAAVFRFASLGNINQTAVTGPEETKYFAELSIISQIISVVFPLISGVIVALFGYNIIFIFALIFLTITIFATLRTQVPAAKNPYLPLRILKEWNKEKTALFSTNLLWGLEFGLLGTIIPVLTTQMLKGEVGWGIFTAVLGVIGVAYASFFQKAHMRRYGLPAIGIFGFCLSATAIFLAINANFMTFAMFMIVLQLWQTTQSIGLNPVFNKIIRTDAHIVILGSEYRLFMELSGFLGRFITLTILLLIGEQLNNFLILGLLFALLGFIPLYEGRSISLSKFAKELQVQ